MAYRFKTGDADIETGLRRIAADQIGKAIASAARAGDDAEYAVHDIRKRCKKLRGLIRIVRPAFAGYQRENRCFRDIARNLSGTRDADVLGETYDLLADLYADQIDRRALASIRRRITLDARALRGDVTAELAAARTELERALDRSASWMLDAGRYAAIGPGLEKTYARGRTAMRKADKRRDPDDFHELRKRAKYHCYHARLLRAAWQHPIEARAHEAKRLADLLGDHHDLTVFCRTIGGEPDRYGRAEDVEVMLGLARRRQIELEEQALALAARLFAEKPKRMRKRFGAYWKAG